MANRTAWTAGNGVGLTWTTAINSADMASIATTSSVLSSVADIANGTNLDIFADLSVELVTASVTPAAGTGIFFWLYALLDGGGYGDSALVSGTQKTWIPAFPPCGIITPNTTITSQTSFTGFVQGIIIPPGSFRFAMNCNIAALTSGTQTVKYRTYNTNLNN
jgi:hypothetical protein